jgi:hypothetical protein
MLAAAPGLDTHSRLSRRKADRSLSPRPWRKRLPGRRGIETRDRHIATVILALHADLEDGSLAGRFCYCAVQGDGRGSGIHFKPFAYGPGQRGKAFPIEWRKEQKYPSGSRSLECACVHLRDGAYYAHESLHWCLD